MERQRERQRGIEEEREAGREAGREEESERASARQSIVYCKPFFGRYEKNWSCNLLTDEVAAATLISTASKINTFMSIARHRRDLWHCKEKQREEKKGEKAKSVRVETQTFTHQFLFCQILQLSTTHTPTHTRGFIAVHTHTHTQREREEAREEEGERERPPSSVLCRGRDEGCMCVRVFCCWSWGEVVKGKGDGTTALTGGTKV